VNPSARGGVRINPGVNQPRASGNLQNRAGTTVQRPVVPNLNRTPNMTLRNNLNAALGRNAAANQAANRNQLGNANAQSLIGRNSAQHPQNWNNWGRNWNQYGVNPAYRNWGYQGAWSGFYGPRWYSGYGPNSFANNSGFGLGYGSGFGLGYGGLGLGYGGYGSGGYGYGSGLFGMGGLGYGLTPWLLNSAGYRSGYSSFTNPYVGNLGGFPYNYSQPVYVTTYAGDSQPTQDDSVTQALAAARNSFRAGDYERALTWIDNVIKASPSDTPAHEFRALTLFALGRYDEAAATLNALLAVAPGWNWATMAGFYADVGDYTQQLRALEAYITDHPDSAAPQFLLAYHYLVTGHPEAAERKLERVVKLEPRDQVAEQLLEGLNKDEAPAAPTPPTETAQADRQPSPEAITGLEGHFIAKRKEGDRFELTLSKSGEFTWNASGDETHKIDGQFDLEGNVMVLNGGRGDTLAATVTAEGPDEFHFKLLGAPPDDPGLDFHRESR
jgi:tetratricopeptide (TPR) repeat protein